MTASSGSPPRPATTPSPSPPPSLSPSDSPPTSSPPPTPSALSSSSKEAHPTSNTGTSAPTPAAFPPDTSPASPSPSSPAPTPATNMPALPEATDAIIRTPPRGHLVIAKGYLPLTTNIAHWLHIRKNHPNPALRTLEIDFCDRPSLFCQSCPITTCRQVELIVALRPLPLPIPP